MTRKNNRKLRLPEDASNQLKICLNDLIQDAIRYDHGDFTAINRSSATLRTLFFQSKGSISLISQLKLPDTKSFISFSQVENPIDYQNIYTASFPGNLLEPNHQYYTYLFHPVGARPQKVKFKDWWHSQLVSLGDNNSTYTTRKGIVTLTANQNGGAHFDPKIDKNYDNIQHGNAGVIIKNTIGSFPMTGAQHIDNSDIHFKDIHLALLRQIVHETILSLNLPIIALTYEPDFDYNWQRKLNFIGGHFNAVKNIRDKH
ncbi:hypothetical protein [Paucilactobacillus sp. N302-9]